MKTILSLILILSFARVAKASVQMNKIKAFTYDTGDCRNWENMPTNGTGGYDLLSARFLVGFSKCVTYVYDAASVDAALNDLKNVQVQQLQTITNLINQNYKALVADPQFRQILEQKVTEIMQAKGPSK